MRRLLPNVHRLSAKASPAPPADKPPRHPKTKPMLPTFKSIVGTGIKGK
jgi:hypothetical protein